MSTLDAIYDGPVPPPPPRRHLIYPQGGPASAVSDPEVIEREAKARAKRAAKEAARRARIRAARLAQNADAQRDGSIHPAFSGGRDLPKSHRWLNRADHLDVLARLSGPRAVALKFFVGRYNRNDWMQKQKDWLPNASLLASAHPWTFDGTRICYCTRQGRLCGLPDFCPRCNLDLRRAWGGATVGAWSENATDAGRVAMARGCSVSAHPGPSARVGGRPGVIADPWGQAAAGAAGGRGFQHSGSRASIWVMFMDGRRRSTSVRYS